MGKAEVGTPKWLANKMKAKGLQRLRWYCQMCEKQCRDENGFKCHCMSEGHQRQMAVFAQRSGRYISDFSRAFEGSFMQLMRTRYCRTKVLANTVYQDLISNKEHVHMNATNWATLTEFVYYLERGNKVKVETSEMGLLVEYVDQEKLLREQQEAAHRKAELDTEERRQRDLQKRIAQSWARAKEESSTVEAPDTMKTVPASSSSSAVSTDRDLPTTSLAFSLKPTSKKTNALAGARASDVPAVASVFTTSRPGPSRPNVKSSKPTKGIGATTVNPSGPKTAVEKLIEEMSRGRG